MKTFGERLRKLRSDKGLNQVELANLVGLSASAIGMYERDNRFPDQETLNKIADYFDVSIDYLLGRISNKKNTSPSLPDTLTNPQEAIKFLLEQPSFMQFGDYDIKKFSDEELLDFANEILSYLKYVLQKNKK